MHKVTNKNVLINNNMLACLLLEPMTGRTSDPCYGGSSEVLSTGLKHTPEPIYNPEAEFLVILFTCS